MSQLFVWMGIGMVCGVVFASFFEWTLHRFVMHRPLGPIRYPFRTHALIHHRIFQADHTYHLIHEKDKFTIPMAWWNGPVLVLLCQVPFVPVAWLLGQWGLVWGSLLACSLYYATYEYIHWCMHLPRSRNLERSGLFFRLNGHHLLHHRAVFAPEVQEILLHIVDQQRGAFRLKRPVHFTGRQLCGGRQRVSG
jgi:hypothetical protein